MKITKESEVELVDIGEVNEIKSTIADENLGLALTMMSKNLYSDPVGSFIREITSNAVDANVDANVDEPVIVHLFEEDGTNFIEFKDNGTGMSPDTFNNIYMSWFNSDKRDTNDKIGGWGLGSKSPFAYQNFFEIITRHDGIKYHYAMSNESTEPKSDLLSTEETDESNGTTVRIEVREEDIYQVSKECERQLAYFNTVYVQNELRYYDNTFNIYEKGLWKLRNVDQPFATMHICLGQVAYPINWEVLGMEPIRIPVALDFKVGDLDVTVSREEINYTEKVREVLVARIAEVESEIHDLYNEQLKMEDLFQFYKLVTNRDKPPLQIEDVTIPMTGNKSRLKFKHFPTLKINKEKAFKLFASYDILKVANGKIDKSYHKEDVRFSHLEEAYLIEGSLNFHDTRYIGSGYILRKKINTSQSFRNYATVLDLVLLDNESNYNKKCLYKPGTPKKVRKLIKFLDNYFSTKLSKYDGICPEHVKEEYREEQRDAKQYKKDSVTYYNANNNRFSTNVQALLDNKYTFYMNRDMSFKTKHIAQALYDTLNENFKNCTELIFVAATAISKLKKHETIIPFNDIFKIKELRNHFYNYNIAHLIEENLLPLEKVFSFSEYYQEMYNDLFDKFGIDLTVMVKTEKDGDSYYNRASKEEINLYEEFKDELVKCTTNKNYDHYKSNYRKLLNVGTELEILQYLCGEVPCHVIASLVRGKGITKMNESYYKTNIK